MRNLPSLLETTVNVIQSLTDGNKTPLHVGEVMACWTYLAFVEEIIVFEEIGLNTTVDKELRDMLEESLKVAQSHKKEISQFMRDEGIPLPDQPQAKSHTDPDAVPINREMGSLILRYRGLEIPIERYSIEA